MEDEVREEKVPVYGLTVSGPGLIPYVDPAFRVEAGMPPLDLVVEAPGSVSSAKVVSSDGILGDVDNTGWVGFFDALLVAGYSRDASIVMPNNGDISLGDVDADGQVDLTDAWLIAVWMKDPSDPALPAGIGEPVGRAASLSPDPSTVTFADDGTWHRFRVEAGEPVSVVANPSGTTPRLEITTRSGRGNFCPAEADDDVSRRDGQTVYLSGCATGTATVELRRQSDGSVLRTYTFGVTGSPADLVVESVSVSDSSPAPGQSFTLRATVRNQGTARSRATTLQYYRSTNRTISTRDTLVGTDPVGALGASRTSAESIRLTAPESGGAWYYGACVVSQAGESAGNNCSAGVRVRVEAASPDLVVQSASVSHSSLTPGQSFTLSATVRNQGTGQSAATTLRWYRSTNATISTRDTQVGTDPVGALGASRTSAESIRLTVPSNAGTWYYGACVVSVSESDTRNNCSRAVRVTVTPASASQAWKLYWTGADKIQRSDLDGSDVEDLVTGLSDPVGIALDVSGGKMYWTDARTRKIQRSNLDGSGVEDLVTTGLSYPVGIALDVFGGKIYWTNGEGGIQRSNLDGSGIEDLVTTGLSFGIALDVFGGKMYWSVFWLGKIQRSNLDGSGVEELVTIGMDGRPVGIALDVSGGKIYWTELLTDKIQRSNLDGSGVEELVTIGMDGRLVGIALDVPGGKIYWTDQVTDKIQRSNLDGSDVEDLVTGVRPGGIALGLVPVEAGPDLAVETSVSDNTLTPGQSFTLSATVRNQGTGQSTATTLRWYRSDDATISTRDTQVGTDPVGTLAASRTSAESISLGAPSNAGTYYYGACVESVSDESNTGNNCSSAVTVTVGAAPAPDLVVDAPTVSTSSPTAGASFTLRATVRNQGAARSGSTTLRYYRSTDATVSTSDTEVGTDPVSSLSASRTSAESISLRAPSSAGTYYYGACVESISDESDTENNCSSAVTVTVGDAPASDLVVDTPTVSNSSPTAGASFTLRATVRNQGAARSGSTTLRYYRSTDATVSTSDTEVGTDPVSSLSASRTSAESIFLSAPSSAGTYYYGACVESVSDESDTGNNCSPAVTVMVGAAPAPDLVVDAPTVSTSSPTAGASFALRATVRNQGSGRSSSTTLRYYRSTDATVSPSDTQVGTDVVSSLSASRTSAESILLSAPSSAGTYYYGACVESVSDESDTGNNCSAAVTVTVVAPDLVVGTPRANPSNPTAGASFTLSATVRNQGSGRSSWTTLRYYRSTDGTISASDTEVRAHNVGGLAASGTSDHSTDLTAPSSAGTYYYGACVESVSDETDTGNNCSSAVTVTVGAAPAPDLVVDAPTVTSSSPTGPTAGGSFTLWATVRNQGSGRSSSTTLRYYRSTDATVSTSDTEVGTDLVSSLSASRTSAESINLRAPSSAGTYYYGACVESVSDESDTGNNCSSAVTVTVVVPDLIVDAPTVSNNSPTAGASFTLWATVRNQGSGASALTTLRYYRSTDATVSTSDTEVGTDLVSSLSASRTSDESIRLSAPSSPGTYYYGACVESVSGESDTGNNCSAAVTVTVGAPDLVVGTPRANPSNPTAGASFTLSATVRNQGSGRSSSTTLRYYRSTDATVSPSDTQVGTDVVSSLSASRTSAESISLRAPSSAGTYYYGACVESVSGESDTGNNCSSAVTVTVGAALAPDLVVDAPTVSTSSPTAGASFTLSATVRNQGNGPSAATTLRFYRSTNTTISSSDTQVGSHNVGGLAASGSSDHSADLAAPSRVGTYYYGACVESVSDESDTGNNCSAAVTVTVGAAPAPDLVVDAPTVSTSSPTAGASFTLRATVRNQGNGQSAATTLRFYRSTNATISASDTEVGSRAVGGLAASGTSDHSTGLTAPSSPGTYYYGACVESVRDETDTRNNCSSAVTVTVGAASAPDLVVDTPTVSDSSPTAGASFTLSATVRNQGNGPSAATTLRFYRSTDATISDSDTEVGSQDVGGLAASGTSDHSTGLTAPSSAGTYYYGACVESVSDETDTGNNCSAAVTVNVGAAPAPDLVVDAPTVSTSSPTAGASFRLSATVRNQGNGQSAATTLRFYRSTDATISDSDNEVGSHHMGGLAASGTSDHSSDLTAPSDAGTYYYGACVESVSDETDTGNNCSSAVTVTVATVTPPATGTLKLYWSDWGTDKIQRADLDGSNVEDLISGAGLDRPYGLSLDSAGGKIYWADSGTRKIQRANLDGSGIEDLLTLTDENIPYGLALDVSGGKIYWVDSVTKKIQRANLDGSGIEDLLTDQNIPFDLALDVSGGKMYWTNPFPAKIQRANLDGSGAEDLVTSGIPGALALDVAGGKMYWTDRFTNKIHRADLSGSNVEDLVTSGLGNPSGIALDVAGGKMYWTDEETNKVQRANLDGTGVEDLLTGSDGLVDPSGIALGAEAVGGSN